MEDSIEARTGIDARDITAIKVMKRMTSYVDSSLTRLGDTIAVPPFWSLLVLRFNDPVDELEILSEIQGLHPMILSSAINNVFSSSICITMTPESTDETYGAHFGYLYYSDEEILAQKSIFKTSSEEYSINANDAWCYADGREDIRVGVYDTGVIFNHEDFMIDDENSKVTGYDYYMDQPSSEEGLLGSFHGTAVAGIIGAIKNNGNGISGIAGGDMKYYESVDPLELGDLDTSNPHSGVSLYDFQIGYGITVDADAAIEAILEGAIDDDSTPFGLGMHIMNSSWQTNIPLNWPWHLMSQDDEDWLELADAIWFANRNSVIFIASRGNQDDEEYEKESYPGCYNDEWVISVGASGIEGFDGANDDGELAVNISQRAKGMDFMAPGSSEIVFSTWGENSLAHYEIFSGTSASSPHAAGIAGLMLSYFNEPFAHPNNLAPEDVEQILEMTCRDRGTDEEVELEYDDETGWGLLTAGEALKAIQFPEYMIVHYNMTGGTFQLVDDNIELVLSHDIDALNAGTYVCDIYEVTYTNNHPNPYGYELISGWPRSSSSSPYRYYYTENGTEYFFPNEFVTIESVTSTSATLKGYIYHIISEVGVGTVNEWLPSDTNTDQSFAYTLYFHEDPLSITENVENVFEIYPNPAENILNVSWKENSMPTHIRIQNVSGKYVKSLPYHSIINIEDLSEGMYFLTIEVDQKRVTRKFVK